MSLSGKNKVLLVCYGLASAGGVVRAIVNLANNLSNKGYSITILVLIKDKSSFYMLNENVQIVSVDVYAHWGYTKLIVGFHKYVPVFKFKDNVKYYMYDFTQWYVMMSWLKKNHNSFDTIVSCWYKISAQITVNKVIGKKTIAWEHTNFQVGGLFWNKTLRKFYKNLKHVICINTKSITYYKQFNENTTNIPNIIGNPYEQDLNIKNIEKQDKLIYVGRLDEDKNVSETLEILANVDMKDYIFKIIGDGASRIKLENYVKSNQYLKSRVEFLGNKNPNEIYDELKSSKIFLFTSKVEGFGLVLVEAMMCANVLMSYDCNYGPSDIVNNENGFLIPMHDKTLFKSKLQYLINNPKELDNMTNSSYENSKNWRKEKILLQWQNILNS